DPDAPFVTYTNVARIKLLGGGGGMAGALLNRFGATRETIYTHGAYQRTDDEKSSQIMDAEGRRIISVDHEAKTYYVMGVDEFVAPMEALTERGMPSMEAPGVEEAEQKVREMKVTVDRRDGTQSINGVQAKRTVAVVESDYEMAGVDEETGENVTIEGKSYTVLDQWHTTELAGYNTIRAFEMKMAEAFMSAFDQESIGEFATAMKSSAPGMIDAMGEAFKELGDIEGMVVRSSIHMVQVPPDQTFNLEAVLEDSATQPTQMDPTTPRAMYTIMNEIGDLTTQPIDMIMFNPPTDGYEQVESPMKRAMEMMQEGQVDAGQ
ncbi:MAG: hypothetical protein HKN37_05670, partial [Rhodothermales bacterium]|nr:hypothetical protein [Rhodothermales bacterium]